MSCSRQRRASLRVRCQSNGPVMSAIETVTPNSSEFCPRAVVPLSIATSDATWGVSTDEAPWPTSSAIVNSQNTSTGSVASVSSAIAFIAASITATPALSSRWRETM